jgi:hypothetical protein
MAPASPLARPADPQLHPNRTEGEDRQQASRNLHDSYGAVQREPCFQICPENLLPQGIFCFAGTRY